MLHVVIWLNIDVRSTAADPEGFDPGCFMRPGLEICEDSVKKMYDFYKEDVCF